MSRIPAAASSCKSAGILSHRNVSVLDLVVSLRCCSCGPKQSVLPIHHNSNLHCAQHHVINPRHALCHP
jgi:hypothetical protein